MKKLIIGLGLLVVLPVFFGTGCTTENPVAAVQESVLGGPGVGANTLSSAALEIAVTAGAESYDVGQTAHFDVTILKDGAPLEGASTVVSATFPDEATPAALVETGPGTFTFDPVLAQAGQASLTVNVLHDYGGAVEAIQQNIARVEAELAELQASLAAATDPKEIHVLEVKISNRTEMAARLEEHLATMETPQASNARTVWVLVAAPSDNTPPVFLSRIPPQNNCGTWVKDPYQMIGVEVTDEGTAPEDLVVELFLNGATDPIMMSYDPTLGLFVYHPAAAWPEAVQQEVRFVARDPAGNESEFGFFFTLDTVPPPTIEAEMDAAGIVWYIRIVDTGSGVKLFSLNPAVLYFQSNVVGGFLLTVPYPSETIVVTAADWAGNEDSRTLYFRDF